MRRHGIAQASAWAVWAMLLSVVTPAMALAPALPGAAAAGYQITGTVLSSRTGAAVPFCRISATAEGSAAAPPRANVLESPPNPPRFGRGAAGPTMGSEIAQRGRSGAPGFPARNRTVAQTNPETKADDSGRFTLDLPHGGSWRVTATARGFRSQAYEEHEGYYSSIVLSESSPTYEAKFVLIPNALITGLVLDEAGEAVPMAQVVAELTPPLLPGESRTSSSAQPRQVANAQSDDRGRYELPGLLPGEYQLRVQAQPWYATNRGGGPRMGTALVASSGAGAAVPTVSSPDPSLDVVYPPTWYPSADTATGAETISLAGGEERQADFHLTAIPASHLVISRPDAGSSEPSDGRPRPQRPVTITRVTSDGSYGQTSFIGGNGREWDFGGLAPGSYEVRLPGPHGDQDGETRQIEVHPGTGGVVTMENSKPLTRVTITADGLPESEMGTLEFIDTKTGRRILASPPPRGRRGRNAEDDEGDESSSSAAMSVMLPPGRYDVSLNGGGGAYVAGMSATGARIAGRTVEIGTGPATALLVHLANVRGELSGVAKTDTQLVSGAMVLLVPVTLGQPGELAPLLRDQSNTDGSFRFQAVVPGRYILVAINHGWGVNFRDAETLARYLSRGVPVEIKGAAKLRKEIVAVLPPP